MHCRKLNPSFHSWIGQQNYCLFKFHLHMQKWKHTTTKKKRWVSKTTVSLLFVVVCFVFRLSFQWNCLLPFKNRNICRNWFLLSLFNSRISWASSMSWKVVIFLRNLSLHFLILRHSLKTSCFVSNFLYKQDF